MRVVAFLLLAGCYGPTLPAGAACELANPSCPSGQICTPHGTTATCDIAGEDRDASTGTPDSIDGHVTPNDIDGDGVPNASDNCPDIPNADQANEDGDATGDACDKCPPFADTGADGDGDGVGDACDPNPLVAGDQIVEFVGFTKALSMSWTTTGTFTIAQGVASASAAAGAGATATRASMNQREHVWAAATLDSIAGTALGAIGVVDQYLPASDDGVECQIVGSAGGVTNMLRLYDTSAQVVINEAPHTFIPGDSFVLKLARNGTNYTCTASTPTVTVTGSSSFAPQGAQLGARVRSVAGRYQWLMVIKSP
jgi:hypothetical protein